MSPENIDKLRKQLIRHEGLRLKPYKCTAGKTTIGVGRNLDDRGISQDEALYMLDNDIAACLVELSALPYFDALTANRQMVLADMCFNLGFAGLMTFKTTLGLIEHGDYAAASEQMLKSRWASQVGMRAVNLAAMMREG